MTIQLRCLQTLIEVSSNQSATIVFPLPIDVLQPLVNAAKGNGETRADGAEQARLDAALDAARLALAESAVTEATPAIAATASRVPAEPDPNGLPGQAAVDRAQPQTG